MNPLKDSNVLPNIELNNNIFFEKNENTQTYISEYFSIVYTEPWIVDDSNKFIQFYPKENFGSLTISVYPAPNTNTDAIRKFIIKLSNPDDDPKNIRMFNKGDFVEFYYEHIEGVNQWITKLFWKDKNLFLLTINCTLSQWQERKEVFFKMINSFSIHN